MSTAHRTITALATYLATALLTAPAFASGSWVGEAFAAIGLQLGAVLGLILFLYNGLFLVQRRAPGTFWLVAGTVLPFVVAGLAADFRDLRDSRPAIIGAALLVLLVTVASLFAARKPS